MTLVSAVGASSPKMTKGSVLVSSKEDEDAESVVVSEDANRKRMLAKDKMGFGFGPEVLRRTWMDVCGNVAIGVENMD